MALPTQQDIFVSTLQHLNTSRISLGDARDWLRSDCSPIGSSVPDYANEAKFAALQKIAEAKAAIDAAKSALHRALDLVQE